MAQEKNKYAEMQGAAQEAQNINSERLRNVALQKQDALRGAEEMQTMAEAGTILANNVGPSTAATLGKYGFPKVTRTQGRDVKIKPNNITITNNNITTTTNNITQSGGGSGKSDGQAKFKTWVSNAFARQKEESSKREKEYNKREWSLSKAANKMLRKMESASKDVAETFNPKNIGTTIGNQFKILLFLFGIKFLAKYWTNVLDAFSFIADKVGKFIAFLGIGEDGKRAKAAGTDLGSRFIKFFGGDPKKDTIISLFKDMFREVIDHFKTWMEMQMALRGQAIKQIKFPDLKLGESSSSGWLGDLINQLGVILGRTFSGVSTYLSDILTALVNPEAGMARGIQGQLSKEGINRSNQARDREGSGMFKNHGDTNAGDYALEERQENGNKKYTLLANAVGDDGKLNGTAGASISQGRDILGAINDARDYGTIDVGRASSGLLRLYDQASSKGGVIVDKEFIDTLYAGSSQKLIAEGKIKPIKMKFVRADMTDRDKFLESDYAVRKYGDGSFWSGVVKGVGRGAATAATGAAVVNAIPGAGQIGYGAAIGVGSVVGGLTYGIDGLIEGNRRDKEMLDKKYILVPETDKRPEAIIDGRKVGVRTYYSLTPDALNYIAKERYGADDFSYSNYTKILPGIEKDLVTQGGGSAAMQKKFNKNKKLLGYKEQRDIDYEDSLSELGNYEATKRYWEDKMNNDPYSQRKAIATENFKELGNDIWHAGGQFLGWLSDQVGSISIGTISKKGYCNKSEIQQRQNYIMKTFTERGMNPNAAAGIIGNLSAEALYIKDTGEKFKDGKSWSVGIAGFYEHGEWPNLKKWADSKGLDWRKFETQVEYLTTRPEFSKIRQDTVGMTPKQALEYATITWGHDFERFQGFTNTNGAEYRKRVGLAKGIAERSGGVDFGSATFTSESLGTTSYGVSSGVTDFGSGTPGQSLVSISYTGGTGSLIENPKVALVGDSYAVGMSTKFDSIITSKGHIAIHGDKDKPTRLTGATISAVSKYAITAVSLGANVVVIHAGINDYASSEESITNQLIACVGSVKKDGIRVFLVAPITCHTRKDLVGVTAKVAKAVRVAAMSSGAGLIDLEPSNPAYKMSKDGLHPTSYDRMATDVANLLYQGGGTATATVGKEESTYESSGRSEYDYGLTDAMSAAAYDMQNSNPFGNPTTPDTKSMQVIDKACELWEKYTDLLSSSFTYDTFKNWWTGQSESLRKRHEITLKNLSKESIMKAVKADPKAGTMSTRQLLEGLGYRSAGDYNRIWNQWIANNQYNMRSEYGHTWSSNKDNTSWLRDIGGSSVIKGDPYANKLNHVQMLVSSLGGSYNDSKDTELLYNAVFEAVEEIVGKDKNGNYKNKYYNDKIGAGILFGSKYQALDKKRKELEKLADSGKIDITSYTDETGRTRYKDEEYDQTMSRLSNYEQGANNYVTWAKGKDKEGRQRAYEATNKFLDTQDEYQSLFDSNKKWIDESMKELDIKRLELGGPDSDKFKEYESKWKSNFEKVQNDYRTRRDTLFSAMGDLSKFVDSETLSVFKSIQDEKLSTKELVDLGAELREYIDGGDSPVDAINKMIKEYGDGMLEKIQSDVLGTSPVFGDFQLQADDFSQEKFQNMINTLDHNIQSAVTPNTLQPLFFQLKDLETQFQALVGLREAGFLNFDPSHADVSRVALKLMTRWDDVQQIETRTRPFGTTPSKEFSRTTKSYDRATDTWTSKTESLADYLEGVSVGFGQLPQGTGESWKVAIAQAGENLENATSDFLFNMASNQMSSYQTQLSDYMLGYSYTPPTYNFNNLFSQPSSTGYSPQSQANKPATDQGTSTNQGNSQPTLFNYGTTNTEMWTRVWNIDCIKEGIYTYNGKRYPTRYNSAVGGYEYNSLAGYAEGGFTTPGAKWDEAGVLENGETVHASEWVAPKWMVQDPAYRPLINLMERSRLTKKAGIEVSEAKKELPNDTVDRLDQLIHLATQGNEYAALGVKTTAEGLNNVGTIIANKPVSAPQVAPKRVINSLT